MIGVTTSRVVLGSLLLVAQLHLPGDAAAQCQLPFTPFGSSNCAISISCQGGCSPQNNRFLSHSNFFYGAEFGAFDLRGTDYEDACADPSKPCPKPGVLPPLRYWAFDQYVSANTGCQPFSDPQGSWIANVFWDVGLGVPPGIWLFYQAQWAAPEAPGPDRIDGCIVTRTSPVPPDVSLRTVAEMSWGDSATGEGTIAHDAYYIVASVEEVSLAFPFDDITGGNLTKRPGQGAATMVPQLVPDVIIASPAGNCPNLGTLVVGTPNGPDHFDIDVLVSDSSPEYLTESGLNGLPQLIAGLQLVYVSSAQAPLTSDPSIWSPVRDPVAPSLDVAGVLLHGGPAQVTVTLPNAGAPHWIAARIVYADASINGQLGPVPEANAPRLVSWTGKSCGPVAATAATCLTANLSPIQRLLAVKEPTGVRLSWQADSAATEYHVNAVDLKTELTAPGLPPGNGEPRCTPSPLPPTVTCLDDTVFQDLRPRFFYQLLSACGPLASDEGPF